MAGFEVYRRFAFTPVSLHVSAETSVAGSNGPYALNTTPLVGDCAFDSVAVSVIVPPIVCAVADVAFDAVVARVVQLVICTV